MFVFLQLTVLTNPRSCELHSPWGTVMEVEDGLKVSSPHPDFVSIDLQDHIKRYESRQDICQLGQQLTCAMTAI